MKYLRIRDFEKYQHYKDRKPPWIKLYRDLWSNPLFFELTEAERYCLLSFFVIASQNDNCIPENLDWLKREMATKKAVPVERLVLAGWIEYMEHPASTMLATCKHDASKMLADCQQCASEALASHTSARSRETERETEKKKNSPNPPSGGRGSKGDLAYELFASAFLRDRKLQYRHQKADFIQLSMLRQAMEIDAKAIPKGWEAALVNYFASDLGRFTLADLCARYDVFLAGPIDRFNRPWQKKHHASDFGLPGTSNDLHHVNGEFRAAKHTCEYCETLHTWECDDYHCDLFESAPCPDWMRAYKRRREAVVS